MSKKIKALTVTIALASVLTLGSHIAFGAYSNGQLDIDDVISNTVANNADINLYKEKIRVKEKWYNDAKKRNKNDDSYTADIKKDVLFLKQDVEIGNLEWERQETQDGAVVGAKKLYYKILVQQDMINVQEKTITRLKKLLEYKKQKIETGTEASISLIDDETNLKNAEVKLEQLKTDKENFAMQLNMKMGTTVNGEVNIKSSEVPYNIFEIKNVDSIIDTMLKKHHTIKSMEKEETALIQEKNITHHYANAQSTTELEDAINPEKDYKTKEDDMEDKLVELKYRRDDEKRNIESKVRVDYNNILNLQNTVESKKLDLDKAEIMLKAEKAKLNAEQSTKLACDAAEEKVLMAKLDYNNAKLDYYIAVQNFKNYIKVAL